MRISFTALTGRGPHDVVLDGDSETTVASVASSLFATLSDELPETNEQLADVVRHPRARWVNISPTAQPTNGLWLNGRALDPGASAVRSLHDGAVVSVGPENAAATVLTEPTGVVEVRVSGGPAAGAVHRLGVGATTLGGVHDADVRLDDPAVPEHALTVTVGSRTVTVSAFAPGATLDETPLAPESEREWPTGGVLVVGATVLTLAPCTAPDAHLAPLDGGFAYNRPPRIPPEEPPRALQVPQPPRPNSRQRLRLLGSLLFAATGVVMIVITGQWWWALMMPAYPVIQVGEWVGDRLYGRKSHKKALREYHERKATFDAALERARRADQAERRAAAPGPAEVLLTAIGPRRRLWERRRTDPDTLHLRCGLADLPARVELTPGRGAADGPEMPRPPVAHAVPVTLPLPDLGVVGLAGPRERSRALARSLVAQATTLHSPRDLTIIVLSADPESGRHWNWVRWLPHCAPREGEECAALVGTDTETVARRVTELAIRITERRRATEASGFGMDGPVVPDNVLVVLDGARLLRRVPGMPQVLSGGPNAGVHAICIDDDERLLPEECRAVGVWDWDRPTHVRLRGPGLDLPEPVLAEQVGPAWCDRLARALAPVRDVSRDDETSIPRESRLLDLLGMPDPTPERVLDRWTLGGRTTSVPLGVRADGAVGVDLRADGPHGLIAGTTGAGKSELLRTLIASLAVANRPDEMTFVLVDDKGGAAFQECAALPHVVGMVTDLDGHRTERALESLAAELRRREAVLFRAGAKDLDDYCGLRDRDGTLERLPRLVLVVDEFATLVGELPEFVSGLVDIGRRGRSLGVHLLMATQRPAGVVTAGIRADTNLRIALRVTSPDDSSDVLDAPDAARISPATPGRCLLRSGTAAPRPMQVARIGGRRPGTGATVPAGVVAVPWSRLGRALPERTAVEDDAATVTDLTVLVSAIRDAAAKAGIARNVSP